MLTLAGVKPIGPVQWKRDNFYLYGVVEPLTGDSFFYEFSHLDSTCFQEFINMVSAKFTDSLIIMQMDQGKIHQSSMLDWPENIIPIFQPPYSPELNPIERFWEHLKAQLKWHNCRCLDELRSLLKEALEEITSEVISSLTGWNFITNALRNLS
jgi:hypothetical protein